MNPANTALRLASAVARRISNVRGVGRFTRLLTRAMLALGATPIVECKMNDGCTLSIDLRSGTERPSYFSGEYDPKLQGLIRAILDPDSCFIDIGANVGFYAIAIASFIRSRGGVGKVVAFEPLDANYKRLFDNIQANELERYCLVKPLALSDVNGASRITLREDFAAGAATGNAALTTAGPLDRDFETVGVRLARLDDVWPDYGGGNDPRIDVVKIDIEGHEDLCLRGGVKTFAEHRPTILMEINKPYYESRGVGLDEAFLGAIPRNYRVYRELPGRWIRARSLTEFRTVDNALLVPEERCGREAYRRILGFQ